MQLTRFDRWLREKFVHEMHIETLRPAERIPRGVRVINLPDVPGKRFKHLYIARSSDAADELIALLKENNQMYHTEVKDRKAWFVPLIAPKTKSVTWWLFSLVVFSISGFFFLLYIKGLVEDPEFRKNFMDAFHLFTQ